MDFAQQQRNPGKHAVGIGIVLALHLLLGWALVTGLAQRMVEVIKAPIETKIIEEIKPPPPPPPENLPPPPKNLPPPPAFVPPPEVNVTPPPTPQPTITTTQVMPPPAPAAPVVTAPPAPPAPAVSRARAAQIDVGSCDKPEYPPKARQTEATGVTKIRFSIDESGQVIKAEITKSSGSSREHRLLDKAAVDALSACRFRPGTDENGKPVGAFSNVEYAWSLE